MHDIDKYLSIKSNDIGPICPIYSTKGFCSWGLTCRFAKAHTDENKQNIKSDGHEKDFDADTLNQITYGMVYFIV